MRKNFGAMTALYPMPVLIIGTYDENGTPDAMNAAWGGISEENEISICISADHKTTANLLKSGAFTVSMADEKNAAACDYVGIVSGNEEPEKIKKTGWTVSRASYVNAPVFGELAMCLECKVKSYDPETCRLVGEIVNISADESALGEDGKIDPEKFRPLIFDPIGNVYRTVGEIVGKAFEDGFGLQ